MTKKAADPSKARRSRVFMVELKIDLPETPTITFFGSKRAIFEYFGNDALGVTYGYSRNLKLNEAPFENNRCRIVEGIIFVNECIDIIERREREGREPLPPSSTKVFQ